MVKSDLRSFLEDEFAVLEEPMQKLEPEAKAFWLQPGEPALSIWGQIPVTHEIPDPPPGNPTEVELYHQLMNYVKPALESRKYGFDTVPVIYPHDRHYKGPPFRTHFLAVVMGAEVRYPQDVPIEERKGYRAWVDPIVHDISEIDALEEVDVSQSPALQAVLRSYEEIGEIVQGRIPFTHYSPTLPLDFAAEIIGHTKFYELMASDPDDALRLIEVCATKWLEMMRLQEKAACGRWVNANYEPGIAVNDMILPFLSPAVIRKVVLPYNTMLSRAYGGIFVCVDHQDFSLLDDYLKLPDLYGCWVHRDWPSDLVVEQLKNRRVLKANFNWHYHPGKKKEAPVCLPWEKCCQTMSQYAGRLRMHVSISGWGNTPREKLECVLGDLDDLRCIWEGKW